MKRAILLFGHGSKDALWHLPIQAVAQRIRDTDSRATVLCAYLELTPPSLTIAATELIAEGFDKLTIVPMFLGLGRHAREDLPLMVQTLQMQYPTVTFELRPAIGEHAAIIDLMAQVALGLTI